MAVQTLPYCPAVPDCNLLDQAMTPAHVVAVLQSKGIAISERTLRERARSIGACRIIGKTMFLMPSDLNRIIEEAKVKPSHTSTPLKGVAQWTDGDTQRLRERLKRGSK